jgi:ankyrin repeat protein
MKLKLCDISGASIAAVDTDLRTALSLASRAGHTATAQALLSLATEASQSAGPSGIHLLTLFSVAKSSILLNCVTHSQVRRWWQRIPTRPTVTRARL